MPAGKAFGSIYGLFYCLAAVVGVGILALTLALVFRMLSCGCEYRVRHGEDSNRDLDAVPGSTGSGMHPLRSPNAIEEGHDSVEHTDAFEVTAVVIPSIHSYVPKVGGEIVTPRATPYEVPVVTSATPYESDSERLQSQHAHHGQHQHHHGHNHNHSGRNRDHAHRHGSHDRSNHSHTSTSGTGAGQYADADNDDDDDEEENEHNRPTNNTGTRASAGATAVDPRAQAMLDFYAAD